MSKFKALRVTETGEWVRIVYDNDYDMWVAKSGERIPPTLLLKRASLYLAKAECCLGCSCELVTVELVVK